MISLFNTTLPSVCFEVNPIQLEINYTKTSTGLDIPFLFEESLTWNFSNKNITTCTPDYQQVKTYNVSVNCNSTLYSNVNSTASYLVTLNDTIPPYFTNNSDNSTVFTPAIGDVIQLNLTINDIYNISSCKLMLNDTSFWENKSTFNLNVGTQYNLSMNYTINGNSTGNQSHTGWRVWCDDIAGNANVSDIYTFDVVDITFPSIVIGANNGFSTNNHTVVSSMLYNITYNITFADVNLFEMEINVTCETSGQVHYWKQLDWNETTLNRSAVINLTNLPPQRCTFFTQASDDHTANKIGNYNKKDLVDGVQFITDYNINIELMTVDDKQGFKSVDVDKEDDRYTFEFKFQNKKLDRQFKIKSSDKLYYREDSGYDGHFVVWSEEFRRGNWIDFETDEDYDYTVVKINDYEYDVTIEPFISDDDKNKSNEEKINIYGTKALKFKSIGGTNITNATYYFFIGGVINVSAFNIYSNITVQDYNLSIWSLNAYPGLNQSYNITTHNILIENISNGTYNFLFNRTDLFNLTYVVNVTNVTQWLNYSAFQGVINIILQDVAVGTILTGANITWSNVNNSLYNNTYLNTTAVTTFFINSSNYSLTVLKSDYDTFY